MNLLEIFLELIRTAREAIDSNPMCLGATVLFVVLVILFGLLPNRHE